MGIGILFPVTLAPLPPDRNPPEGLRVKALLDLEKAIESPIATGIREVIVTVLAVVLITALTIPPCVKLITSRKLVNVAATDAPMNQATCPAPTEQSLSAS